jgi:copper chaperone NosL
MQTSLERFYAWLTTPIAPWSRLALALAVIPLALSLTQPLWSIFMQAPQYPNGLSLDIYAHTIESGNEGRDLSEINTLNHYIGMHKIDRAELSDLDWIPFAIGALSLLALRVAAIGDVRALLDLSVLLLYFSGFSIGRFAFKLYTSGHNLDPSAPVKLEPFTPAILGTKQIANFTTQSSPRGGTFLIGIFALIVVAVTVWHIAALRPQPRPQE